MILLNFFHFFYLQYIRYVHIITNMCIYGYIEASKNKMKAVHPNTRSSKLSIPP
jgi:hypothetical protein